MIEGLSAAVRAAILEDLTRLEAFHLRRMEEHRSAGNWIAAEHAQALGEAVRCCIVSAQAAASRALREATR